MFPLPLEFLVPLFVELLLPEDLFLSLPIVVLRYGSERKKCAAGITLLPNSSTTFSVSENQRVIRLKANGSSKNGNLGLKKIIF